ncbi:MAG: TlpA family protein disulfide reductase [Bacteroidetes bacterium]|nr:TlpA family protein disulfide reductase [Bacteroidota bacterium]
MIKICFLLLFVSSISYPQQIKIEIKNLTTEIPTFSSLEGENVTSIDAVASIGRGIFIIDITSRNLRTGFYRLSFDKNRSVDFIYDGMDVSLTTEVNHILDSMMVISSESNRLYYSFVKLNKSYKAKSDLLQLILARYPKDDEFYDITKNRLSELQLEYLYFINEISQTEPESFIARYIKSGQLPVIDGSLPLEKQLEFLKENTLTNVNFNDSELIYSDLFTNKSIEYLTYYRNPQLPKELLEKEFQKAVDVIINKAKVNQLVYQHVVDYLIDGFKKFGFDLTLDYIIENYVVKDDLCLDEETENSIQNRVDQAQLLYVGAIIPNVVLPDSNGTNIDLSKIVTAKVVILFYASWCPHCKEMIPKLRKVYESQQGKEFEVVAISLDSERNEWLNFVEENCPEWLNVNAPDGWDSKVVLDFYIYATPTIFVVDKEKKIIGKPLKVEELIRMF